MDEAITVTVISKGCKSCGEHKSIEDFHKDKKAKDGRRIYCKQCIKEMQYKIKERKAIKPTE